MTKMLYNLKGKLKQKAVYRILKTVHDWIVEKMELCVVFPLCLGFVMWPGLAVIFFINKDILWGIGMLMIYATYWLHIYLFED